MPIRATPPHGAPCWVDLTTSNVDASRRFYTELLGWRAQEADPDDGCQIVERLGGKVLEAPVDTPYGRMATVSDSNGTPFKIMTGNGTPPDTLD